MARYVIFMTNVNPHTIYWYYCVHYQNVAFLLRPLNSPLPALSVIHMVALHCVGEERGWGEERGREGGQGRRGEGQMEESGGRGEERGMGGTVY